MKLRYLLVPLATVLAGLMLSACDPIQINVILSEHVDNGPTQNKPDGGQPPDEVEEEPQIPDAGQLPDAGCWQSRELAANVTSTAFAFDSQGVGHVAVSKSDNQIYVGSTWPEDVLVPAGELKGSVRGLVLDAEGSRHLLGFFNGYTYYGQEQSGAWQSTLMPWNGDPVSLKVDAWGFAHILYTQFTDGGLQFGYATNRSGMWMGTGLGIDVRNYGNVRADLAVDIQGNAHIAWNEGYGSGIHYATNASGSWVAEEVEDIDGSAPVLAIDRSGRPHLLYSYLAWRTAHHAVKQGGTWKIDAVGASIGNAIDLKVDAAGDLHALLDRSQNPKIVYATLPVGSGTWRYTPIIGLEGQAGATELQRSVLGVNSAGTVSVGYWYAVQDVGNSVRYARPCP